MASTFKYRIEVENADEIKRSFQDIQSAYKQGITTEMQAAQATRELSKEARVLTGEHRAAAQIFLASHPALLQLRNTMETFGGAARTVLSVVNALNIAQLAMMGQSDKVLQLQSDIADLNRQLLHVHTSDEANAIIQQRTDKEHQLAAALRETQMQQLQNAAIFGASAVMITNDMIGIVKEGPQLVKTFKSVGAAIDRVSHVGLGASGPLGSLTNAFAKLNKTINAGPLGATSGTRLMGGGLLAGLGALGLATGGIDAIMGKSDKLEDKLKAIGGVAAIGVGIAVMFPAIAPIALIITLLATATVAILVFRKEIVSAFEYIAKTLSPIWEGMRKAFLNMWNGMVSIVNSAGKAIVDGINFVVGGVVAAINTLIDVYNGAASVVGARGLAHVSFSALTFTPLPMISAATGFQGKLNQDTMFLAHKGEDISIIPPGRTNGGGSATFVNSNVAGNVATQNDFFRAVDNYFKTQAKRHGFNGLLA